MIAPSPNKKQDFDWNLAGLQTRAVRPPRRGREADGLDGDRVPAVGRPAPAALGRGRRRCRRRPGARVALQRVPHRAARRTEGAREGRRGGRVVADGRAELPRAARVPRPRLRGGEVAAAEPAAEGARVGRGRLPRHDRGRPRGRPAPLARERLEPDARGLAADARARPGPLPRGRRGRRRRGLGRRRPLRQRPRVDLHDPRRPGPSRPRPRHAGVRRGAGASRRGAGAGRPRGRGARRDAGRPRPLRAARIRGRPAARADEARGPAPARRRAAPSLRPERDGLAATRPMARPTSTRCSRSTGLSSAPTARPCCATRSRAAPGLAHVTVASRRVRGYCFGRHGDHSDHVGPVVAEDPAVARELVARLLSPQTRERPVIVDARAPVGAGARGARLPRAAAASRACTSATCGRRRGRRSSSPCAGRRWAEEDVEMKPTTTRDTRAGARRSRSPSRSFSRRRSPVRPRPRRRPGPASRPSPRRPRSSRWTSS